MEANQLVFYLCVYEWVVQECSLMTERSVLKLMVEHFLTLLALSKIVLIKLKTDLIIEFINCVKSCQHVYGQH